MRKKSVEEAYDDEEKRLWQHMAHSVFTFTGDYAILREVIMDRQD